VSAAAEQLGYELYPRDFYSPIPVVDELPAGLWDGPGEMRGTELSVLTSLANLNNDLLPYLKEFRPPRKRTANARFWLENGHFGSVDAETLYAMVRHLKPSRVFELGSGASSQVIYAAALANASEGSPLAHSIFDPLPYHRGTAQSIPGATVHAIRAEELDPALFDELESGDILFIDTTHTVRTGGDVTHVILNGLPRLKPGVTVHVHDIFLPWEYPKHWVVDLRRAFAEQYLLQAFLAFNTEFEVVLANHALARQAPEELGAMIPSFHPGDLHPASLWMRRSTPTPARRA